MSRFSRKNCIAHGAEDAHEFIAEHLLQSSKALFLGTVGVDTTSLYFPALLGSSPNIDFRFFVEQRGVVPPNLATIGEQHKQYLSAMIKDSQREFYDVEIISADGATVAGRNAVNQASQWHSKEYRDVVIDSTGMSRGICFPLVKQALQMGIQHQANVHLLVAANDERKLVLKSESNDRADWMHGFQGRMGLDSAADALKLWVPQLSEGSTSQMNIMYEHLSQNSPVSEVCPIIPFPSMNPRRGDELLFEYREALRDEWDTSHLNIIYAHESDPMDVFRSIIRMDAARKEVFAAANKEGVTVLSPSGWRIGSLGIVLAAIELDLPMLYVEAIGYTSDSPVPNQVDVSKPERVWHIWLTGAPYENAC